MGQRHRIEELLAAVAVFALCLSIAPGAEAQMSEGAKAAGAEGSVPFGWESGARPSVTRLRADLIQRVSGEWVLVNLRPRVASSGVVPAGSTSPAVTAALPSVSAALREYERAFERRDADRLASVLLMDLAERARVQRLFDQSSTISLSVQNVDVFVEAGRASLHFDQRMVASARPNLARAAAWRAQRSLFAHDAYGNWGGIVGSN
jgi:hypothetical protein